MVGIKVCLRCCCCNLFRFWLFVPSVPKFMWVINLKSRFLISAIYSEPLNLVLWFPGQYVQKAGTSEEPFETTYLIMYLAVSGNCGHPTGWTELVCVCWDMLCREYIHPPASPGELLSTCEGFVMGRVPRRFWWTYNLRWSLFFVRQVTLEQAIWFPLWELDQLYQPWVILSQLKETYIKGKWLYLT